MSVIPLLVSVETSNFSLFGRHVCQPKYIALMLNKNLNMAGSCKNLHTCLHMLKEQYFSHNRFWILFSLPYAQFKKQ